MENVLNFSFLNSETTNYNTIVFKQKSNKRMAFLLGEVDLKLIKAEKAKLFEFLFLFFFSYMDNSL